MVGQAPRTTGSGRPLLYLAPDIERLPDADPVLRFVVMMCEYALEVARGERPVPYTDESASRFALKALSDDDEWSRAEDQPDTELGR